MGVLGILMALLLGLSLDAASNDDEAVEETDGPAPDAEGASAGDDTVTGADGGEAPEGGDDSVLSDEEDASKLLQAWLSGDALSGEDGVGTHESDAGEDAIAGWVGEDPVLSALGMDALDVGEGDDTLTGEDGADTPHDGGVEELIGGASSDTLNAFEKGIIGPADPGAAPTDQGDDLDGGASPIADTATGGAGEDVFPPGSEAAIAPEDDIAPPVITNFNAAEDQIVVYYDDPTDSPIDAELVDDVAAGQTEVQIFGETVARLDGLSGDLGIDVSDIALVNTAL